MASPPPLSQLVLTRSIDQADAHLRHPTPDLQSLQGAYVGNIERLEEHAERMSERGSDLGEEIRKLHTELKLSDSRRSSLRSNHHHHQAVDEPLRQADTRSRGLSTSSHANSIVDVNGTARWGGYSPAGYITSPVGSVGSSSWANAPTASGQRQRSESKASRLGQVVHREEVEDAHPVSTASPKSLRSAPLAGSRDDSPPPPDHRKVSSFTREYDQISQQIQDDMRDSANLDYADQRYHDDDDDVQYHYPAYHDPYARPPTAASTNTMQQARTLWHDFDGAHAPDTVLEEPGPSQASGSRHSSMVRALDLPPQGVPPPEDNMVFYPAPVPRMLNLPKRLSQLPASDVQARRRTQILESIQAENRKSVPKIGEMAGSPSKPNRKSRQSLAGLPPALRASAYFDHQAAPSQEFAVQGESAKDTLDSILDASARAPVSAFTDHPYSGHVGDEVYGQEHKRKSSKLADTTKAEETKRRSSFNVLDTKYNSNGDPLNKLKKRNSSADMNLLIVRASENRMSLGGELDEHDEYARGPQAEETSGPRPRYYAKAASQHSNDEPNHHDHDENDHHSDSESDQSGEKKPELDELEEQHFGAPTTLLAELQMRKARQKTRNMNYATLVEQGMLSQHRTLLQLDDEAEKERQKRIRKKVQLAWEAQDEEDDSDDDVPLGILYKQNNQRDADWDRPLGLIEQRELEDNEPLSLRRNRLLGSNPNRQRAVSPNRRGNLLGVSPSQQHFDIPTTTTPGVESDDDANETLADRMRRLRDKQILDSALGEDTRKSTVSGDFATEMLSKLGVTDNEDKDAVAPKPTPSPGAGEEEEEEETLGQRRARLQAEAAASGNFSSVSRPGPRSKMTMADVLSANPMDIHHQAPKLTNEALISQLPPGSLLQRNVVAEERRKAQRLNANMRSSSYGVIHDPLVRTAPKVDQDEALAAKIQAYKNMMSGVVPPSHKQQQQQQQQQQQPQQQQPQQQQTPQSIMYPGQMMGMMPQPNFHMMQPQHTQQMNPMMGMQPQQRMPAIQQPGMMPMNMNMPMVQNGMPMPMGMNMQTGMPMQMSMNMQPMVMSPPMHPQHREMIDRWMQDIKQ